MEQSRDNGCCSSCHLILHQPYIGKRIYTDASVIFFESVSIFFRVSHDYSGLK